MVIELNCACVLIPICYDAETRKRGKSNLLCAINNPVICSNLRSLLAEEGLVNLSMELLISVGY